MTYRLCDTFCCEGGTSTGYARAGFDVYGVDLFRHVDDEGRRVGFSRKRYPFPSHQGDAIAFIWSHGHEFDVLTGSPPCQHASTGTRALRRGGREYPRLIEPTRDAMIATGRPYVIENVRGAALRDPLKLCGCMFDLTTLDDDGEPLRLERPRYFESNVLLRAPRPCRHDRSIAVAGSYGGSRRQGATPAERRHNAKHVRHGGYVPSIPVQQRLLGVDWMTQGGMNQCVPPIYAEWIGQQLMAYLDSERAARTVAG